MYTIQKPDKDIPQIYQLTDYSEVQGEDCILYCKCTASENKGKSPAVYNLGMISTQEPGDENLEDYDEDEDYDDEIPDLEIVKEWSYRKIGPYVGLCRLRLFGTENTGEVEVTEDLLYVSPRFPDLSVAEMLKAILNDKEMDSYIETGMNKGKENWLISFDFEDKIDLSKESFKDIECYKKIKEEYGIIRKLVHRYLEKLRYKEEQEHKDYVSGIPVAREFRDKFSDVTDKKEIDEKSGISRENQEDIVHPYAINMAVLFECYVRGCIKIFLNRLSADIEIRPYGERKQILISSMEENIYNYMESYVIPDIILKKKNQDEYFIFDAKYKEIKTSNRSDRLQILAYAYLYHSSRIGHVFPKQKKSVSKYWEISSESDYKTQYGMFFLPMEEEMEEQLRKFLMLD